MEKNKVKTGIIKPETISLNKINKIEPDLVWREKATDNKKNEIKVVDFQGYLSRKCSHCLKLI